MRGIGDLSGIFGEHSTTKTRNWLRPGLATAGEDVRLDVQGESTLLGINRDFVASLHESKRTS